MKYPKYLPENGTIGFVAPSFGCAIEPYRTAFGNALKKFEKLGHSADIGSNCYEDSGIGISNTPEACGRELTDYYCSVDNDVLISCGGGEMMCETMNHVDFDRIRQAEPKWFMGYSDNTNMTFLLATICDTASIYGPCAAAFGMEPWHQSIEDAYALLRGKKDTVCGYDLWEKEGLKDETHPLLPYNVTEKREMRVYLPDAEGKLQLCSRSKTSETSKISQAGPKLLTGGNEKVAEPIELEIEGRLLGGCMDCLVNLPGTKYDKAAEFAERYREDGIIWFLEACDLNVMGIRRAVWQMKNAGWFSHVKGIMVGRPYFHGQEMMGLDQYHAVCDLLEDLRVPILMDLDIGHLPPMMPLVTGAYAKIAVSGNEIAVTYDMQK